MVSMGSSAGPLQTQTSHPLQTMSVIQPQEDHHTSGDFLEESSTTLECDVCDQQFEQLEQLAQHKSLHVSSSTSQLVTRIEDSIYEQIRQRQLPPHVRGAEKPPGAVEHMTPHPQLDKLVTEYKKSRSDKPSLTSDEESGSTTSSCEDEPSNDNNIDSKHQTDIKPPPVAAEPVKTESSAADAVKKEDSDATISADETGDHAAAGGKMKPKQESGQPDYSVNNLLEQVIEKTLQTQAPRLSTVTRRSCHPDIVQFIWTGIIHITKQKNSPALNRLSQYLIKNFNMKRDTVEADINKAVRDKLVKLAKRKKSGDYEISFRLPTEDMNPSEKHDWYCFHCHAPGEVLCCSDCHRVYHERCIKQDQCDQISSTGFVCFICRTINAIPTDYNKEERTDLNNTLIQTTARLKIKMPDNIKSKDPHPPRKSRGGRESLKSDDHEFRAKFLLKRHIDLEEVMEKCRTAQYRIVEEFKADIQNIVHNVVIYHGAHSGMADQARQMFRECGFSSSENHNSTDPPPSSSEPPTKRRKIEPKPVNRENQFILKQAAAGGASQPQIVQFVKTSQVTLTSDWLT